MAAFLITRLATLATIYMQRCGVSVASVAFHLRKGQRELVWIRVSGSVMVGTRTSKWYTMVVGVLGPSRPFQVKGRMKSQGATGRVLSSGQICRHTHLGAFITVVEVIALFFDPNGPNRPLVSTVEMTSPIISQPPSNLTQVHLVTLFPRANFRCFFS